nr:YHS domain-containing protein [Candidatus Sigynarchaeota archaeon]
MQCIDPVCNRVLDDESQHQIKSGKRTFYFCSESCKESFKETVRLYSEKRFTGRPQVKYSRIPASK